MIFKMLNSDRGYSQEVFTGQNICTDLLKDSNGDSYNHIEAGKHLPMHYND